MHDEELWKGLKADDPEDGTVEEPSGPSGGGGGP